MHIIPQACCISLLCINKIAIPYPQRAGPGVERGAGLERTPLSLDEELFLGHLELANNSKRNGDPRGLQVERQRCPLNRERPLPWRDGGRIGR